MAGKSNRALEKSIKPQLRTTDSSRDPFKAGPVGRWSQAVGTFGAVMDEHWEFRADGTGRILETGPFGGEDGEILFEWKPVSDFCISCRVTQRPELDIKDDAEEEEEADEWETVRYGFKAIQTDAGDIIAMCEALQDGTLGDDFWLSHAPLANSDSW